MTVVFQLRVDAALLEALRPSNRPIPPARQEVPPSIGSYAWLRLLEAGTLPTSTVHGRITQVNLGGASASPEFEMQEDGGERHRWPQVANYPAGENLYEVGRGIEVDFVRQWHRAPDRYGGAASTCVIRIRIGEGA